MAKRTNTSAGTKASARTTKAAAPAAVVEDIKTKAKAATARRAKSTDAREDTAVAAKPKRAPARPAADEGVVAKATRGAKAAVESISSPVAKAARNTTRAASGVRKSAAQSAANLLPDIPSMPTGEVGAFVKSVGNQIVGALNTDVGRVMVAELLVYVAKSLTQAAASTETGKDAKEAMVNVGAKIGAAAANAGAKFVETGAAAATSGADAADGARGLVREVAQVAVSTVGSVVAEAAAKVMRGKKGKPDETAPSVAPAPSGTPRPPQL